MKTLIKNLKSLKAASRWDIDFHLPPEGIKAFTPDLLRPVSAVASFPKDKRDPTKTPEVTFHYVDISAIDVQTGMITNPQ